MSSTASRKGFTLVEIMIVVGIIGLLAAMGIPKMLEAGMKTRAARMAREFETVSHAFVQYAFEHGDYPADRLPAEMPDGMDDYLAGFPWGEQTAIGGRWDWDYEVFGVIAGVSLNTPDWNAEQMAKIDHLIDNGDLGSGQFRQRSGGYIYVLEE